MKSGASERHGSIASETRLPIRTPSGLTKKGAAGMRRSVGPDNGKLDLGSVEGYLTVVPQGQGT